MLVGLSAGCTTPLLKSDELRRDVPSPEAIPATATSIRFAVYGDNRLSRDHADRDTLSERRDRRRDVVEAIAAADPQFVIHAGDLVERGDDPELWRAFLNDTEPLLRPRFFYPAAGNHEYKGGFLEAFHEIAPNGTKNVKGYTFWAGPAYIIVFDSSAEPHPTAAGQFHEVWFNERLLDAQSAQYLFVVSHHPLYSSGRSTIMRFLVGKGGKVGHAPRTQDVAMRAILKRNLEQRRARDPSARTIVLTGHSHFYERYAVDGIDYVVTGGGGAPSHVPAERATHRKAAYEGNHFVEVSCSKNGEVTIEVVPVGTGTWIQRSQ